MYETAEDRAELQGLLDRTFSRMTHGADREAGAPLSAQQVVAYLQGIKHVAFATVNGTAVVLERDHAEIPAIEAVYPEQYESGPFSWGDGVVIIRVVPSSMWSYSSRRERFAAPQ